MPITSDTPTRPDRDAPEPKRPAPEGAEADYGEDGPPVRDEQAGLSEGERLEDAVADLSNEER